MLARVTFTSGQTPVGRKTDDSEVYRLVALLWAPCHGVLCSALETRLHECYEGTTKALDNRTIRVIKRIEIKVKWSILMDTKST